MSAEQPNPSQTPAEPQGSRAFARLNLPASIAGYAAAFGAMALVVVVLLSVLSAQLKWSTTNLEDIQIRLYGIVVVFGLVYALLHHSHVRMDLIRQKLPQSWRIIIEIIGVLLLQIPMMFALTWWGWDKFLISWQTNEVGGDGNGLPWLWSAKAVLPLGAGLVVWASIVQLIELISRLRGGQDMIADEEVVD